MNPRPPLPRPRRDGTIHWTSRSILQLAEWERDTLTRVLAQLPATLERVTDWTPSAVPGTSQGERVNGGQYDEGGNKNGPVPAFVIRKNTNQTNDHIVADTLILIHALQRVQQTLDTVNRAMTRLSVLDPETARAVFTFDPVERRGAGECRNPACGHHCTGERDDRLIQSRCRRCYDHRRQTGTDRAHEDCHPQPVGGCGLCEYQARTGRAVVEAH